MLSKSFDVNKCYSFREILHKISNSTGDYLISNLMVNEFDINYDLTKCDNEVSVTLLLSGDTFIFPCVDSISITMEEADINVVNSIKRMFIG